MKLGSAVQRILEARLLQAEKMEAKLKEIENIAFRHQAQQPFEEVLVLAREALS